MFFFFFKQKTAYEMRISDWSSDVCSSDLRSVDDRAVRQPRAGAVAGGIDRHWQQIDLGRSDEARDEFGARGEIDVHRAADLLDAALIEHDDPVGERHRINLIVGDEDHRRTEPLVELPDFEPGEYGRASCRQRLCTSVSILVVTV